MEAPVELKFAAALLVFLTGMAGGLLARKLLTGEASRTLARVANTFAGGIFLGAALVHMLPDAREKFLNYFNEIDYPYFTLVMGVGFLLILFIDKVLSQRVKDQDHPERSSTIPYALALILSVHSLITGIALGLERHLVGVLAILVAVLAHKATAAMALAISLFNENVGPRQSQRLLWIFYATTPTGIILGTFLSTWLEGRNADITEGLFDALAAGTFVYIAVVDILAREFQEKGRGVLFAAAVLGFGAMALLAIWT